jgi:cell division transport system ATP-binding protein
MIETMKNSVIKVSHLTKHYPNHPIALDDISFELAAGEFVFLTGHSGAGKSTLLKILSLLELPSSGQIQVFGEDLTQIKTKQIPIFRRQLGIVHQDHRLLFDRDVFSNVALPLEIAGYDHLEIRRRVRAALEKIGLWGKESFNPMTLSGGEQQRVGIARAVVNKPRFLIADEPTGNLDPALSSEIMALFKQFSRTGVTVLIATHEIELVRTYGQRVLELRQGQLARDQKLSSDAQSPEA